MAAIVALILLFVFMKFHIDRAIKIAERHHVSPPKNLTAPFGTVLVDPSLTPGLDECHDECVGQ